MMLLASLLFDSIFEVIQAMTSSPALYHHLVHLLILGLLGGACEMTMVL